ncbi:MAG: hypothetical protein KDA81_00405 [Planctomycetaceae bacterium]|nr:hypothetical protein [Planctomycetaceae bacterium]
MRLRLLISILILNCVNWCSAQTPPAPASGESWYQGGFLFRRVSPADLAAQLKGGTYVPVRPDQFDELLKSHSRDRSRSTDWNAVRKAEYRATLVNESLESGTVALELYGRTDQSPPERSIHLGALNLSELRLFSQGVEVPVAVDSQERSVVLTERPASALTGSWTATGTMNGEDLIFQLRLPRASLCSFELETSLNTQVTSPNALVIPSSSDDTKSTWLLMPRSPSLLTLVCSRNLKTRESELTGVSIQGDYRFGESQTEMSWSVNVPRTLTDCDLQFLIQPGCQIAKVDSTPFPGPQWTTAEVDGNVVLNIKMPPLTTAATLGILGRSQFQLSKLFSLPVIRPMTYRLSGGTTDLDLPLRFSTCRLNVAPELAISHLDLTDFQERDVTYSSDGGQALELVQNSAAAGAEIGLVGARPLVEDSVAVELGTGNDRNMATANVFVSVATGALSEVSWNIPRSWRVTDVFEADSRLPLLFQIESPSDASGETRLTAFLRNPLTTRAGQLLTIEMQSTENRIRAGIRPALINSQQYRRKQNLLIGPGEELRTFGADDGMFLNDETIETITMELGRLGVKPDQTVSIVSVDELQESSEERSPVSLLSGSIDYSALMNPENFLRESFRLRLRSQDAIPERVPLAALPGLELTISDVSVTQPTPSLRPVANAGSTENWVIEVPPGLSPGNLLDITLTATRPFRDGLPMAWLSVPSASTMTGTLRPLDNTSGIQLLRTGEPLEVVSDVLPYPDRSAFGGFVYRSNAATDSRQDISGNSVVLLDVASGEMTGTVFSHLLVHSSDAKPFLGLRLDGASDLRVFVDGKATYAHQLDDTLRLALPEGPGISTVDLFYRITLHEQDTSLAYTSIGFPFSDSVYHVHEILPPVGFLLEPEVAHAMVATGRDSGQRLVADYFTRQASDAVRDFSRSFRSRWNQRRLQDVSAIWLKMETGQSVASLTVINTHVRTFVELAVFVIVLVLWLYVAGDRRSTAVPAVGLMIGALLLMLSGRTEFIGLRGAVLATVTFLVSRFVVHSVLSACRAVQRSPGPSLVAPATVLLVLTLLSLNAAAQTSGNSAILVPHTSNGDFPLIYVPQSVYSRLETEDRSGGAGCHVLEVKANVHLSTRDQAVISIDCLLAVDPAAAPAFRIPLSGATLSECFTDGVRTWPSPDGPNEVRLDVSSAPVIAVKPLVGGDGSSAPAETSAAAAGPNTFGQWNIKTVRYVVRVSATELSAFEDRISVTLPPAATTEVRVKDDSHEISRVVLVNRGRTFTEHTTDGQCRFPPIYNARDIDLYLRSGNRPADVSGEEDLKSLLVDVDATPTQLKVAALYRLPPAESGLQSVSVRLPRRRRITAVETTTGNSVPWSVSGDTLQVRPSAGADGFRRFVVRMLLEYPVELRHSLPVGTFANVDGERMSNVILAVSTSEQFVVGELSSAGVSLSEPDPQLLNRLISDRGSPGASETYAFVPPESGTVDVLIAQRDTSLEVTQVQNVTVTDDEIQWNCRCSMDVRGQPVLRQQFEVSPEVDLESVSVSTNNSPLLQTWTRSADLVIVALREPTRGVLEFSFQGVAKRTPQANQPLPTIRPAGHVQLLESKLVLRSEAESDVFLHDLGSGTPDVAIDIREQPLSDASIHLDLTDDLHPPILGARLAGQLRVAGLLILHDEGGPLRISQLWHLQKTMAASEVRLGFADGSRPAMYLYLGEESETLPANDDELLIAEFADSAVLVVEDQVVTAGSGVVEFSIPVFADDPESHVVACLDFREGRHIQRTPVTVPEWARTVFEEQYPDLAARASSAGSIEPGTDASEGRVRLEIEPPLNADTEALPAGGALTGIAVHQIVQPSDGSPMIESSFVLVSERRGRDVSFVISPALCVLDVQIDGLSVPFRIDGSQFQLSLTDNLHHIRINSTLSLEGNHYGWSSPEFLPLTAGMNGPVFVAVESDRNAAVRLTDRETVATENEWKERLTGALRDHVTAVDRALWSVLADELSIKGSSALSGTTVSEQLRATATAVRRTLELKWTQDTVSRNEPSRTMPVIAEFTNLWHGGDDEPITAFSVHQTAPQCQVRFRDRFAAVWKLSALIGMLFLVSFRRRRAQNPVVGTSAPGRDEPIAAFSNSGSMPSSAIRSASQVGSEPQASPGSGSGVATETGNADLTD